MLGEEDMIPCCSEEKRIRGKLISVDKTKKEDLTKGIKNHQSSEVSTDLEKRNKYEFIPINQESQMSQEDSTHEEEVNSEELNEDNIINNVEVEIIEDENYSAGDTFITDEVPTTPIQHFLEGNPQDDLAIPCYSGERTKKKKSDPREWRDYKNRRLRELGQNYVGWSRASCKNGNKAVAKRGVEREGRRIGPTCSSPRCKNSAIMQCNMVPESAREDIFHYFWHDMTWDQKKSYVVSLVQNDVPKRRRKGEVLSRRSRTLMYNLRMPTGETLRVCKTMFLSTLALGEWSILNWVNRANAIGDCEIRTFETEEKDIVENLEEKE